MRRKQFSYAPIGIALLVLATLVALSRRWSKPRLRRRVSWRFPVSTDVHMQPAAPPMRPRVWEPHPPTNYETVGFLEADGETRPLLARRSHNRRHRWHYSTTNDARSPISALRLPVVSVAQGQKCTSELGCEELYDGDTVTVPGSTSPLRVQLYEKHFG